MQNDDPIPTRQSGPAAAPESIPQRRFGRRGLWIGVLLAVLAAVGLGWLAWSLTQPGVAAGASAAGPGGRPGGAAAGGPGGPAGPGAGARGGPATTVGVAVAERSDIPVTLDALGTVVPQATVRVRPQVSGVLQQVHFREGQLVRRGELLATIDPRQFEMAVQQASGQRMRDEAQLEAARVTLQRFRTLLQQDSIARQEVDTQAALVKQLEAAVVISKANEGTARLNLGYTRITSPIAGRVGLRTVDVGNVVSASDANGVALVTQLSPIDVEFSIPQDQAASLQQAAGGAPMEAKAFDRTRATVLETGSFSSLDNQVDTQTGTVRAKARFANEKQQLFPSQFVNLQLRLRTIQNAVTVPIAAVRTGANGDYVFVLRDDRTVQLRNVQRGQSMADRIQIVQGLQAGERVVTEGADRLRDGARVTLPGADPARGPAGPGAAIGPGRRPAPTDGPQPAAAAAAPASAAASQPRAQATTSASVSASASAGTAAAAPAPAARPTPEQRRRLLDSAPADPEQLERRRRFVEALDRGDPQALARWQQMQRMQQQGGAPAGGNAGPAR
jgi:multidrug efflux system membrane fusion protein